MADWTYVGHEVDQTHGFLLAQLSEVVERARCEEVGEVLRKSQESVKFLRVLRREVCGAKALDLRLELGVAKLRR